MAGEAINERACTDFDPNILAGKPVVKSTRLALDFLLGLFAAGWIEDQLFESYPSFSRDVLRAVVAFAAEERINSYANLGIPVCGCRLCP